MKRLLASLACGLLLLSLLPLASPAARMITDVVIDDNGILYLGDTIVWTVSGQVGTGPYLYSYDVFVNDELVYDDTQWHTSTRFSWRAVQTGSHRIWVRVQDQGAGNEMTFESFSSYIANRVAPEYVVVDSVSATAVKVTWGQDHGAAGYEVWMSLQSATGYTLVRTVAAPLSPDVFPSFTKAYLTAGTRYFFKVRSYVVINSVKQYSPFSAVVGGVPLKATAFTTALSTARDRITLAWPAVPFATGYRILSSSTAAGRYSPLKTTTATTILLTGLKPNTAYYFKVQPYKRFYTTNYYGPLSAYRGVRTLR